MSLQVIYLPISELKGYERNARTHSEEQIEQVAQSILKFGWTNPILVGEDKTILAGHGRLEAAKFLKMEEVPTICIKGLTKEQFKAYVIADNKLAEQAGWDMELLKVELEELADADFDLSLTGFDNKELDKILGEFLEPQVKDISDELEPTYKIEIECESEMHQEEIFNKLEKEGLKCRLLTL